MKIEEFPNGIYIDKLRDKVEHLFNIEREIRKPLYNNAKDRLYKKAVIQYFKELRNAIYENIATSSKPRFLMTYPSEWTPEQVSYLRSLIQTAGIVDEEDHPDRLLMYSEGESLIRILQRSKYWFDINIKCGHRYLICNMKEVIKMNMYDIEVPVDAESDVKVGRRCDWDINYMKELPQLCIDDGLYEKCEAYLRPKLGAFLSIDTVQDTERLDDYPFNQRESFELLVSMITTEVISVCFKN